MTKYPSCDFWAFEELPNGRVVEIERSGDSVYESDLRNERYDLDVEKWSREWYWTARQAACISFLRDPAKIDEAYADNDLCGIPSNEPGYKQHVAIENAIAQLTEMITDAQKQRQLHPEFFCPDQYFAWASRSGVDFPKVVYEGVHKFLHAANSRADKAKSSLDLPGAEASDATSPKARGGAGKLESSAKEIVLALLIKYAGGHRPVNSDLDIAKTRVRNLDLKTLAGDLSAVLNNLDEDVTLKGDKHPVRARTIQEHLSKAIDLLK